MRTSTTQCTALTAFLVSLTSALDGIVVPSTVAADQPFQATFQNPNSDSYRVFLAAALAGVNGPTCYLNNSTSLASPVTLTIPASVGRSAGYYSIAIADLSTNQGPTFSNRFNLTGGTGQYSDYEQHLNGAPFWNAYDLPCTSYDCARQCAQSGYPSDLTDANAYNTMSNCIMNCDGVKAPATQSGPPLANSADSSPEALVTLAPGAVMTAFETAITSGGSTITEALLGSQTVVLGGAAATLSSQVVSLATDGIAIGSSITVSFSTVTPSSVTPSSTAASGSSASATRAGAAAASSSKAAASKVEVAIIGAAGGAALAMLLV